MSCTCTWPLIIAQGCCISHANLNCVGATTSGDVVCNKLNWSSNSIILSNKRIL
ncbi:hypothetical protein BDW66DRAFT_145656 [Aspergillus desertorum]